MSTRRCRLWLAFAGLGIGALSALPLAVSHGPALAVTATPPTVVCPRALCRQCLEYSGPDNRCLKCGHIPGCRIRRPSAGAGGLSADAQAILNAHNGYRAKHCVPNLSWSAQLAANAQSWASGCRYGHSGVPGENIAWRRPTLSSTQVVGSWYSEIGQYNFSNPIGSYRTGKVGHFTQVVWRGSSQLGCAVATCAAPAPDGANSSWGFMVCRYAPPGNFNAQNPGVLDTNVPRLCR